MLGEELVKLHDAPRIVPRFSERYPELTPESGYAAARMLHAHRVKLGWRPVGRKIGFTNRTLWERYGVHEPMWGMVYDRTLVTAQNDRAQVSLEGLVQPRIEPEVCFKLRAVPSSSDMEELISCIEWMAHSVEIVQCHHPEWKVTISDCTTDNGLHGRLILGSPVELKNADELPALKAKLFKAEGLVDEGVGANVLGSPLLSLGFLIDVLEKQPEATPLRAGEIITTGVLTDAHPVRAGEMWRTEVSGFPGLTILFK